MPLSLTPSQDWLDGVRRMPSPNCDERPPDTEIELVVIHGISLPPGEFGGPHIDGLFTNTLERDGHPYFKEIADLRVSAHLLVDRRGMITQYVPFHLRAWHAGASEFRGRQACNDFSIGIEVEGSDELPYEPVQYRTAAEIVGVLMANWPRIKPDRIVGHADIAPGRKTDPGPAFDWRHFFSLIDRHRSNAGRTGGGLT